MTISEALREAASQLAAAGIESAEWDAELLLLHFLECDRAALLARGQDALHRRQAEGFRALVAARARRQPLQHITGRQAFWRQDLIVTPDVLIPRPETEVLVDAALARIAGRGTPVLVDVGTGSGNIALALAHERRDALVHAIDISEAALAVARTNAERLGLSDRIRFHHGDLLEPVAALAGSVDLIVSNPPYVGRDEAGQLQPEVVLHEPPQALFAPGEPLALYGRLASSAHTILSSQAWLLVEVGQGMAPAVAGLLRQAGFDVEAPIPDLAHVERVVAGRRPT